MKAKLFFTFFVLFFLNSKAQKITLTDLEILTEKNFEEFSNFSIKKSYKLLTSKNNYLEFYFQKSDWGTYVIKKDESATYPVIMYMVSNQLDYQELQKQLKEKKYIYSTPDYSSDDNSNEMASFSYKREDEKYLAVIQITNDFYKIYVYRNNN